MEDNKKLKISTADLRLLDELFDMKDGYVLDFTNRRFSEFFQHEIKVDIYAEIYSINGTSKAKRLRYFLTIADKDLVIKILNALWNYRKSMYLTQPKEDPIGNSESLFIELIKRISGNEKIETPNHSSIASIDKLKFSALKAEIIGLNDKSPQERGYAFEDFLQKLFEVFNLAPRKPFRLCGEQIDGSFQLDNDVYLVEAKWKKAPIGVADLHTFHGKLEQKSAWTRGIFISESGFTPDGLVAFGKGKRVICMDGFDIYELLDNEISLQTVLSAKVRYIAETGVAFISVRDLKSKQLL